MAGDMLLTGPYAGDGQHVSQIHRVQQWAAHVGIVIAGQASHVCLHCVGLLDPRAEACIHDGLADFASILQKQSFISIHQDNDRGVIAKFDQAAFCLTHGLLNVLGHIDRIEVYSAF